MFLCIYYLEQVFKAKTVFAMGNFNFLEIDDIKLNNLYMDAQALAHMEIMEVQTVIGVTEKGSLFSYLDHTATPYGKRLLKRWVTQPLRDCDRIRER